MLSLEERERFIVGRAGVHSGARGLGRPDGCGCGHKEVAQSLQVSDRDRLKVVLGGGFKGGHN